MQSNNIKGSPMRDHIPSKLAPNKATVNNIFYTLTLENSTYFYGWKYLFLLQYSWSSVIQLSIVMEQLKQNINRRNRIVSLSQTNSNASGITTTMYIYSFKCHIYIHIDIDIDIDIYFKIIFRKQFHSLLWCIYNQPSGQFMVKIYIKK